MVDQLYPSLDQYIDPSKFGLGGKIIFDALLAIRKQ